MSEGKYIGELGKVLHGRLLDIWEGRSGLAPAVEDWYRDQWREEAGLQPQSGPCRFFGDATGETIPCIPCGGRVRLKVFQCSHPKHAGKCTIEATEELPNCNNCRKRERMPKAADPAHFVPDAGIVVGMFGMPGLARLQIHMIRETCGDVPILLADDGSERDAELQELADSWKNVTFWPSDTRRGHYAGDLSVFWKGLQWAHNSGLRWLVKISQRFVFTEPGWLRKAIDALEASGEATLMQDCIDNGGGNIPNCRLFVRSECMGFDVAKWAPHYREFNTDSDLGNPTELYVWHRVNSLFGGRFCPWPGMPVDRYASMPGTIWHASHGDQDYRDLGFAKGIDLGPEFTAAASQSIPGWKRG